MGRANPTLLLSFGAALIAVVLIVWSLASDSAPAPDGGEAAPPPGGGEPPVDAADGDPGPDVVSGTRVWIEVEVRGRLSEVPPFAVAVHRHGMPVSATVELVAGSPPESAGLVRVHTGGETCYRRVLPAGSGDSTDLVLGLGAPATVHGRVVDQQASPVPGARVWCGGELDDEVLTDADGRFEVTVAAGDGVPIVVRHDGHAWKAAFFDAPAGGGEVPTFVLAEEQALAVQVVGAAEAYRESFVAITPMGPPTTELQAYPAYALGLLADTAVDAGGRATVPGLPRGARVGVALVGPGMTRKAPAAVDLRGVAPTRVELHAAAQPQIEGTVVDERGLPVAGARVWSWAGSGEVPSPTDETMSSHPWLPPTGVAAAETGADGAFRVALGERGGRWVAVDRGGVRVIAEVRSGDGPLRLCLPTVAPEPAVLRVPAPTGQVPWSLRVDPWTGGRFVEGAPGVELDLPVDGPFVVDLRVRVADGPAWPAPRTLTSVVLSGVVTLPPELLSR